MDKLLAIQSELKAPKDLKNTFGGYHYRSCESILEALKPLLKTHGLVLTLCDDIVAVGTRIYVRATATLSDIAGATTGIASSWSVTAFAREEETKKGMDSSQITGAASSYARKYALNGLFLIDDTKDSDGTNDHGKAATADPLAEAAAKARATYNMKTNPAHTDMSAMAPKAEPKPSQALPEGVKTCVGIVSYANAAENAGGWRSFCIEGQQLPTGKDKYFQAKDPDIKAFMLNAIQSGKKIKVDYTETPWEKNGKSGLNIAIFDAQEEATVPF